MEVGREIVVEALPKKALRESIEHWKEVRDKPWQSALGPRNCPLCWMFHSKFNPEGKRDCTGCPVAERVHDSCCDHTPYDRANWAHQNYEQAELSETASVLVWYCLNWRIAAQKEIDFLKSLEE